MGFIFIQFQSWKSSHLSKEMIIMLHLLHCVFSREIQISSLVQRGNGIMSPKIIMLRGCKLIPSDSWHSATLMMHTINLGKLTNKLSKLRDKLTDLHFFLIEICSQWKLGKEKNVIMLGKVTKKEKSDKVAKKWHSWGKSDNVGKDSGNVNFVPH